MHGAQPDAANRRHRPLRMAACVLVGLAVTAVAGCGSDDQPAAVTSTSEPTAPTGVPTSSTTTTFEVVVPDIDVSIVEDPGPPPADAPVPPDLPTCPPDCP